MVVRAYRGVGPLNRLIRARILADAHTPPGTPPILHLTAERREPRVPSATRLPSGAVVAAVALHLLALVPAALVRPALPVTVVSEPPVVVRILTPGEYAALVPSPPEPEAPGVSATVEAGLPPLMRATTLMSGTILDDPRNHVTRDALPNLEYTDRMIQLCALEAMEQIHAWKPALEPEWVSAYALADVEVQGDTVRADGAAFRSTGVWRALRFECALSRDHADVVAFAFAVGDAIPYEAWEALDLNEFDTE